MMHSDFTDGRWVDCIFSSRSFGRTVPPRRTRLSQSEKLAGARAPNQGQYLRLCCRLKHPGVRTSQTTLAQGQALQVGNARLTLNTQKKLFSAGPGGKETISDFRMSDKFMKYYPYVMGGHQRVRSAFGNNLYESTVD